MFGRRPDPIITQRKILQDEIERVKLEMETAYSNFEHVLDPDLIDCYPANSITARLKQSSFTIRKEHRSCQKIFWDLCSF